MSYSLSDFKTRKDLTTPAKKDLWNLIIERTFGGIECAKNAYETNIKKSKKTWNSYKITGMIGYLDELTGGDYGRDNTALHRVAGTLAYQFKSRFPEIMHVMSGVSCSTLDEVFFVSNPKKQTKSKENIEVQDKIDFSKVYSILSEIHSNNLNESELQFISKNLYMK